MKSDSNDKSQSPATGPVRLLIVRHGIAVDAREWAQRGGKSRTRPLTRGGRRKWAGSPKACGIGWRIWT